MTARAPSPATPAEVLARARAERDSPGGHAVAALFAARAEAWREELIRAEGADVPRLQGAIRGVRETLKELAADPRPAPRSDGAYA